MSSFQRNVGMKIWSDLTGDRERPAELETTGTLILQKIRGNRLRYMSDFGALDFYPHPDLSRDVLGINPEFFAIGTYRGVQTKMLATNGDNIKWQTLAEKAFISKNEKQGFVIRDIS